MPKLPLILYFVLMPCTLLLGQTTFPERVERAFGTDQELVNGIQFSNHYGQVDGHPYFLDERFRAGSVSLADQCYEQMKLRYNLYSQRVEMAYQYAHGNQIQFMSVPELIRSFSMENRIFTRMQFGEGLPAYYQVLSSGKNTCFIAWRKDRTTARKESFMAYQFSAPIRTYWLKLDGEVAPFHNRKTFVEIFPEQIQRDVLKLLRQLRYSFKNASVEQSEEMILAALAYYEKQVLQ